MTASGLSAVQAFGKRLFDIVVSAGGLLVLSPLILFAWILAGIGARENGMFRQQRVGKDGRLFRINKLKTMRRIEGIDTTVTTGGDPRITRIGKFLRRTKLDELPQLWNILVGEMSFVGPRPDVPGFADQLEGEDRLILTIRPGITGPATLRYANEEELLREVDDPEQYNREVIWPEKVRLNREYVENYRFRTDIACIWQTLFGRKG